mgnify:CR=1 FL=1
MMRALVLQIGADEAPAVGIGAVESRHDIEIYTYQLRNHKYKCASR